MKKFILKFKEYGFVNIGNNYLQKNEVSLLASISKKIFKDKSLNLSKIPLEGAEVIENICLYDKSLTCIISKLLSSHEVKNFLDEIVGKNHKIWAINFRRSYKGDSGLYLHQDGVGQINMAILLDDNFSGDGSTIFLSGSHLIKKSQKKLNLEIPVIILKFFPFLFSKAKGKKGDIIFFSNKTWHGRTPNFSTKNYDILLIGFFPSGYSYNAPWPDNFIRQNRNNYIGNFLANNADKNNGLVSNCELRDRGEVFFDSKHHGFSLQIELDNYLLKHRPTLKLRFILFFLFSIKLIRMLKKLKGVLK